MHTIDLEALYRDRTHADNRRVAGGDVLYIPQQNRRILVLGAVGRPGAQTVDSYTRVLDALAMAGGLTRSSDSGSATLTRIEDGEEVVLDLDLNAVMENRARNLEMRGGDVLFVPEAKQALVFGKVSSPGAYIVPPGGTMLDILAAAGGINNEDRTQEIVLTRQHPEGDEVWAIDYEQLMHNQRDANHLLSGEDVIFVPETKRQILVLGEVSNPGVYTVSSPTKLLEAISMAGGPTDKAALQSVGIYRYGVIDEE